VHCHAIGDRSTRLVLDAIERAIAANPNRDRRHTICHLTIVSEQDLDRFAKLNVIGQYTTQWAVPDETWTEVTMVRMGAERANHLYRYGTLLRDGATVALGSDWPADATDKPLDGIEVAVTRRKPGAPNDAPVLPPLDERIDLAQALRAGTLGAAYQLRLEDVTGSIEVGKYADLVVLEKNLFNVPANEIHKTPVVMTMMNGRFTHE
jgi:predicted amidohydrolase YtcJ